MSTCSNAPEDPISDFEHCTLNPHVQPQSAETLRDLLKPCLGICFKQLPWLKQAWLCREEDRQATPSVMHPALVLLGKSLGPLTSPQPLSLMEGLCMVQQRKATWPRLTPSLCNSLLPHLPLIRKPFLSANGATGTIWDMD